MTQIILPIERLEIILDEFSKEEREEILTTVSEANIKCIPVDPSTPTRIRNAAHAILAESYLYREFSKRMKQKQTQESN